ncbi:MAG: hypothetical protein K5866_02110 [Treponema sp.]|nr:hypothetical protein [Treponema sp.]
MKKSIKIIISTFLLFIITSSLFAQIKIEEDMKLIPNPAITKLTLAGDKMEPEDFVRAALIASGVPDSKIPGYLKRVDEIYNEYVLYRTTKNTQLNDAEAGILFLYDKDILVEYDENQTYMDKLLDTGLYNCVSSAVLYMYMMKRKGFKVIANETPTHVFCTVLDNGKEVDVETTNPFGYKPGQQIKVTSAAGKKYSPFLAPGAYDERKRISGRRLISTIYSNRIVFLTKEENINKEEILQLALDSTELQLNTREALQDLFFNAGNVMYYLCNEDKYLEAMYVTKAIQDKYAKYGRSQLMLNNTAYAFRKLAVSKPDDHDYYEKLMLNYGQYLSTEDYDEFYEIYVYNKVVDLYWAGSYLEAKELLQKGLDRLTYSKSLRDLELQLQEDENFKD